MRDYVLLAALLAGLAHPARAGDGFLSGGLGVGGQGLGWNASGKLVAGRLLFGLRVCTLEELTILGPSPSESVRDYGVLIGLAEGHGSLLRYGGVGVGFARSVRRGRVTGSHLFGSTHERLEETAFGGPFEAGIVLHGSTVGVGVGLFGNLNSAESIVGVSLTLNLGTIP